MKGVKTGAKAVERQPKAKWVEKLEKAKALKRKILGARQSHVPIKPNSIH